MIDTTKIYSTQMFLEACLRDEMMLPDIYDFVENKTAYDFDKMQRLKHSFYQFKLKVIGKKLPEIQASDKYIQMEENGERIPMMTPVSKYSKEQVIEDKNLTAQVVWDELDDFINEFLFEYFIHLDQAEQILNHIIDERGIKQRPANENSMIMWKGTDIQLTEWLKAPIIAKMIQGKDQKTIFNKFQNFLNVPEFDETERIRTIKKRKKEVAALHNYLENTLNNWAKSES